MKNHNIKMLFNEIAHIMKYKTYSEKQYLVTQALSQTRMLFLEDDLYCITIF